MFTKHYTVYGNAWGRLENILQLDNTLVIYRKMINEMSYKSEQLPNETMI